MGNDPITVFVESYDAKKHEFAIVPPNGVAAFICDPFVTCAMPHELTTGCVGHWMRLFDWQVSNGCVLPNRVEIVGRSESDAEIATLRARVAELEGENALLVKKYAFRLNQLLSIRAELKVQDHLSEHVWAELWNLENRENHFAALAPKEAQ